MEKEIEPQPKREITIAERKILLEKERQERESKVRVGVSEEPEQIEDEIERLKGTDTKVIIAIATVVAAFVIFFVARLIINNIPPKELDYHTFNFTFDSIKTDTEDRVKEFYEGFGALDINIVDDYTTSSARRGFEQRISLLYVASRMTSQGVELEDFKSKGFQLEDDHVSIDVSYTIVETDRFGSIIRSTDATETLKLKYFKRRGEDKWMIYQSYGSTPDEDG